MSSKIVIRGARVHNLKNIDLEIPRDQLVVITGVSGSGKSSLAFDTLYAEGQRRYLEALAVDARQFIHQIERPDVDTIDGLSPAIAIEQKAGRYSPRSTVGTMSEIYDYLRLLFARVGQPNCVQCGCAIKAYTTQQIVDELMSLPAQTRLQLMAPIAIASAGARQKILRELARNGFARVRIGAHVHELSDAMEDDAGADAPMDLIVDRIVVREGVEKRLADSIEVAARAGAQIVKVSAQSASGAEPASDLVFSQKFACVECGSALPEITPTLFSFNSPSGACSGCSGSGVKSKAAGRKNPEAEATSNSQPCTECEGRRLRKESLAIKMSGRNIAEVSALPVVEALEFFRNLQWDERERAVGKKILDEITSRLRYLMQVGVDYLSLDRAATTLSGGEAQRVRLATQIGAALAGVLYILDEPSIGLHQKDNARLLALLQRLRESGNSVILVEHDPDAMRAADYLIDMGPGAGEQGGSVVACGTPKELMRAAASRTGQYLSGQLQISPPAQRRKGSGVFLTIKGAREHNLKNLTVQFPIGALTCVTGVSGSGKSSLVMDILYNEMARRLHKAQAPAGSFDEISGAENFDRVIGVDQSPIGRTPRSNPATYTGIHDHLRELFAQLPEARLRGYKAERFSFNAKGGRCEACGGDGVTQVDMYFLADVFVTCEVCKGRRYNRETLDIKYKGLSIADVLDLTVAQAAELLASIPAIFERLRTLRDVGLGYLRLGQSAATLSGGEAQRVKLARELARRSTGNSLYILDEPTSGLHFDDIRQLLDVLNRLIDAGNTMVIIEHNLDVIKCADYVIDLGPQGGRHGGEVVAAGAPEEVCQKPVSLTGQYLRPLLVA
ncbi:MAG: excinuclease ABC subunit A [Deltaproteobacteria bacterium]|nr:excinuclease ABC subunit A [Deltaproteobacteria bacterium]